MIITNNLSLPEPLVRAVTRHPRERAPNRISVTELIQPPQVRGLALQHEAELQEDASDRIWALMGTLLHGALETHAQGLKNVLSEEALSTEILGWTVVGHYDLSEMLLDGELLSDYKLTSVWSVKEGLKREWIEQVNVYAHLIRLASRTVSAAQIVAIGRDWSLNKARYDSQYPQQQVKVLPVELWTSEQCHKFLEDRVFLHQQAEKGTWPECTAEERWAKPDQWAVMKKGQKKAVKLYNSLHAAEWAVAKDQYIQERKGESTRCELYCSVSGFCDQFKHEKESKSLTKQLESSIELLQNQEKEKTNDS